MLLKPLSRALADGDTVYCVIRGSAINNDGASNGLTAPNPAAQVEMLRDAYANAGVDPAAVHYVEAHGTGTALGDPIEAGALGEVLGSTREAERPLVVGSVKTNLGHLEIAAGVAGLIKAALALQHRQIPPSLHFERPNPLIPFAALRLQVASTLTPWPAREDEVARAGVSAFGWGGTNCHLVLESAESGVAQILPLAADSREALRAAAVVLRARAADPAGPQLLEMCRESSQSARGRHRLAITARTRAELVEKLDRFLEGRGVTGLASGEAAARPPKLAFVFAPEGAQWEGMGRALMGSEPTFRAAIEACDAAIQRQAGWSLLEEMTSEVPAIRGYQIDRAQPVTIAYELALVALWRAWGIAADVLVGPSLGDFAAVHAAGVLDLDETMRVLCEFGALERPVADRGSMAALELPREQVALLLLPEVGRVWLAGHTGPQTFLITGELEALDRVIAAARAAGAFAARIQIHVAAHCPHFEPIRQALPGRLGGLRPQAPRVRLLSCWAGRYVEGPDMDGEYFAQMVRREVRFEPAVQRLLDEGVECFVEISAHPILRHTMQQSIAASGRAARVIASARRHDERAAMLDGLGALFVAGAKPRWESVHRGASMATSTVIAEAASQERTANEAFELLPLSARSPAALVEQARRWADFLAHGGAGYGLRDVAYTAQLRRSHLEHRLALVGRNCAEFVEQLRAVEEAELAPAAKRAPRVVFVFPGYGAQWLGMGRRLAATEPVFRRALVACDAALSRFVVYSVLAELDADADHTRLGEADVVQPLTFALQVALAGLLRHWGVEPAAVVGHSMGEVAAAYVAGALSLEDAARVIVARSRVVREHASHRGGMLMLNEHIATAKELMADHAGRVSIAVVNAPRMTVLSGDLGALETIAGQLQMRGVFCRRVNIDYASHSPHMDPLLPLLREALTGITARDSRVPFCSTVTAEFADGHTLDAAYWARNLREPVQFAPAIERLSASHELFVEISTHPLLVTAIEETLRERGAAGEAIALLRRDEDEALNVRRAVARLHERGCTIDFAAMSPEGGRPVPLPTYAWQRERYWIDVPPPGRKGAARSDYADWLYRVRWEPSVAAATLAQDATWVLLDDRQGLGESLCAALWAQGRRCLQVGAAEGFAQLDRDCFVIDPRSAAQMQQVLALAQAQAPQAPLHVVHLWSLDIPPLEALDETGVAAMQALGCVSALHVVQALARGSQAARLSLVTQGAQATSADAPACSVGQVPLWGMGRVLAYDFPALACKRIDLDHGPAAAQAEALLASIDVAAREPLAALLTEVRRTMPPIRGVLHAAGTMRMVPTIELDGERLVADWAPKIEGTLNLCALLAEEGLEFFALYASSAGVLALPGMAGYAAANAFLDGVAQHLRAQGRPALSVDWGAWAEAGMVVGQGPSRSIEERLELQGIPSMAPGTALAALGRLLALGETQAGVMRLDAPRWLEFHAGARRLSLLRSFRKLSQKPAEVAARSSLQEQFAGLPVREQARALEEHVRGTVAAVLGLKSSHPLDPERGLRDLGLDSLLAVELRRRLAAATGLPLPATLAFDYPTVRAIAGFLRPQLVTVPEAAAAAPVLARAAGPEDEAIAIVGIGCRYPGGAGDAEQLWRLLCDEVDVIREIPADRWDIDAYYDSDRAAPGKMYARGGGFLEDADRFDAAFFNISPREALRMDPQQRVLLEVTWEALEDAGLPAESLVGTDAGVFVTAAPNQYLGRLGGDIDAYAVTGNLVCTLSGRISYVLGLRGPNVYLDTGCSGSLVAVHLACQSLRTGECRVALAGGVNLMLDPALSIGVCKMGALAPDARCKTFDAAADGFVRSEGCGMVVLKRLADAQADGDRVLAVIRGSATGHDGASSGLTAPSGPAQQAVIRKALAQARVEPGQVAFVETHGTGTELGDPIEVGALAATYGAASERAAPCLVGAIKSNLGHTEAAAGVAGLIKVVQALRNGQVPSNLHFRTANPKLPLEGAALEFPTTLRAWPAGAPRIAAVSSFGLGGTNAHAIVAAAPEVEREAVRAEGPVLVPLSARHPAALRALAEQWCEMLAGEGPTLPAIAATAALRRSHHNHRLALVARDRGEAASKLGAWLRGETVPGVVAGVRTPGASGRVVFVFSGQGSQWIGMGRTLAAEDPAFRDAFDACEAAIQRFAGWSLRAAIHAAAEPNATMPVDVIQPAIFAVQVALAAALRARGVEPDAVVGHSMGEVAAAQVAGVLGLEDAVRVICTRSRLARERASGRGGMAVVELSVAAAEAWIAGRPELSLAVHNSPRSVVLSGDAAALDEVLAALEREGVWLRRVQVDYASHSPQMDPLLLALREALAGLRPRAGSVPFFSTVTGRVEDGGHLNASYWANNLRAPVRFAEAIQALAQDGTALFVELSPHPLLTAPIEENLAEVEREGAAIATLRRTGDEAEALAAALGSLYVHGYRLAWERLYTRGAPVHLPKYPWQHQRFWVDPPAVNGAGARVSSVQDLAPVEALAPAIPATLAELLRRTEPAQRREVLATALRERVGAALAMPPEQLEARTPFTSYGLDSMMAAQLRRDLERQLGLKLASMAIWSHPTVEALTLHLERELANSGGSEPAEQDCFVFGALREQMLADRVLASEIRPQGPTDIEHIRSAPALLTGATGFVGAFLLDELLRTDSKRVVCLARANSDAEALARIEKNLRKYGLWQDSYRSRIEAVHGDVSEPQFGLDDSRWNQLAQEVGSVFHAAATVNFLYPYSIVAPANVGGTCEALRFACTGRTKAFHHISTRSVIWGGRDTPDVGLESANLDAFMPWLVVGYAQSKWVAEHLVMEARNRGLPANIYRLGHITGHSETAAAALDDMVHRIMIGGIQMGLWPSDLDVLWELTPADFMAAATVYISRDLTRLGQNFHVSNPHPMKISKVRAALESHGYPLAPVTWADWWKRIEKAHARGESNALTPFIDLMLQSNLVYETFYYLPHMDTTNMQLALAGGGPKCPPVDRDLLAKYVKHMCAAGLLPPPQWAEVGLPGATAVTPVVRGHEKVAAVSAGVVLDGSSASRWLQVARPRRQAVQLVCFHHAGGGASMFHAWADAFGPGIEVCAVQLPGREERTDEAPLSRMEPMLEALEQHLEPQLRRPCVFFGHSMGALVAFEFARRMAARGRPGPGLLALAGYRAPGVAATAAIHDLPEPQFREALRRYGGTPAAVLADDELMRSFSPLLRADLAVGETWDYRPGPPLDCPIIALAGDDDPVASSAMIDPFAAQTRGRFRLHTLPGGHFFVHRARDAVLAVLRDELARCGLTGAFSEGGA